jgi:hypothetical protein
VYRSDDYVHIFIDMYFHFLFLFTEREWWDEFWTGEYVGSHVLFRSFVGNLGAQLMEKFNYSEGLNNVDLVYVVKIISPMLSHSL